jgi:hypothetical protein
MFFFAHFSFAQLQDSLTHGPLKSQKKPEKCFPYKQARDGHQH